ncbi:hypothetical protein FZEAL_7599 [Fusarium zealandicum]|uniref:N-acetyltransferase domain-containing protein n=1 Tax=Fusarium zealandicum TaxID=1053134 RepID=A0A8H4XIH6_9HYPO|nr:hypothetical protein FZEAL_7599 [Fusarium zealandicum]
MASPPRNPPRSSSDPTIERAQADDIPDIRRIVHDAYSKYVERIGRLPAPMTADYQDLMTRHDVFVLRAGKDNTVVGSIVLQSPSDDGAIQINNLVIDPAAQGRGFGRILLNHAEDFARSKGCHSLTLFTNAKMWENLSLYPKMGFIETARKVDKINMPLINADTPPSTLETHYVVYFASGEPSWCPDCVKAMPALKSVFDSDSAPTAHVVRVGSFSEWKGNPRNKYRNAPYNIQGVPTVVRIEDGKEVSRLGDIESQNESALKKLIVKS